MATTDENKADCIRLMAGSPQDRTGQDDCGHLLAGQCWCASHLSLSLSHFLFLFISFLFSLLLLMPALTSTPTIPTTHMSTAHCSLPLPLPSAHLRPSYPPTPSLTLNQYTTLPPLTRLHPPSLRSPPTHRSAFIPPITNTINTARQTRVVTVWFVGGAAWIRPRRTHPLLSSNASRVLARCCWIASSSSSRSSIRRSTCSDSSWRCGQHEVKVLCIWFDWV